MHAAVARPAKAQRTADVVANELGDDYGGRENERTWKQRRLWWTQTSAEKTMPGDDLHA